MKEKKAEEKQAVAHPNSDPAKQGLTFMIVSILAQIHE